MSQHVYEFIYNGRKAQVTLGFDARPHATFFMRVAYLEGPKPDDSVAPPEAGTTDEDPDLINEYVEEEDMIVYVSDQLDQESAPSPLDLGFYRRKLRSLRIQVPESMFREVKEDAKHGTMNRIGRHFDDGRVEELLDPAESNCRTESSNGTQEFVSTEHEPAEPLPIGPSDHMPAGYVRFEWYQSGEIAMELLDARFEPMGTATAAVLSEGGQYAGPFAVWLKDWAENESIPQALIAAGLVKLSGHSFQLQYVSAKHAELTTVARDMYVRAWLDRQNRRILMDSVAAMIRRRILTEDQGAYIRVALAAGTCTRLLRDGLTIPEIIEKHKDGATRD